MMGGGTHTSLPLLSPPQLLKPTHPPPPIQNCDPGWETLGEEKEEGSQPASSVVVLLSPTTALSPAGAMAPRVEPQLGRSRSSSSSSRSPACSSPPIPLCKRRSGCLQKDAEGERGGAAAEPGRGRIVMLMQGGWWYRGDVTAGRANQRAPSPASASGPGLCPSAGAVEGRSCSCSLQNPPQSLAAALRISAAVAAATMDYLLLPLGAPF